MYILWNDNSSTFKCENSCSNNEGDDDQVSVFYAWDEQQAMSAKTTRSPLAAVW